MATLPRPDVTVSTGEDGTAVVISRGGKAHSHSGGTVKEVIEKILDDPRSAEWIARPGETRAPKAT
jgi:hypothetical protein